MTKKKNRTSVAATVCAARNNGLTACAAKSGRNASHLLPRENSSNTRNEYLRKCSAQRPMTTGRTATYPFCPSGAGRAAFPRELSAGKNINPPAISPLSSSNRSMSACDERVVCHVFGIGCIICMCRDE